MTRIIESFQTIITNVIESFEFGFDIVFERIIVIVVHIMSGFKSKQFKINTIHLHS